MHAPVLGGGLISRTLLRTGSPSFLHASPTGARRRRAVATAVLSLAAVLLVLPCAFASDNLSVTGTGSIGTLISGTASIDVLDSGTDQCQTTTP